MAFEKQAPTWSAPGVEPPESKKQEGWQVNDKPPAAWLNWFMSLTAGSLKELQDKAAEKAWVQEQIAAIDVDIQDASLTQKGITQLSNATNSTSEAMAATPKAVKAAYDKADAAETPAGAQAKANAAESNAKNASLPRTGGTVGGTVSFITELPLNAKVPGKKTWGHHYSSVTGGYYIAPSRTPDAEDYDYSKGLQVFEDDVRWAGGSLNDLKSSVANGKQAIATAISGKGVPASGGDEFAVLANKISQIKTGVQVATGNTATSSGVRTIANLPFKPQILVVYGHAVTFNNSAGYRAQALGYAIAYNVIGSTLIGSILRADLVKDGFGDQSNSQQLTNVVFGANSVSFDGVTGAVSPNGTAYIVFGV